METRTKHDRPPFYQNHPPADLTARPLMIFPNHAKKTNDFFEIRGTSFAITLLFLGLSVFSLCCFFYDFLLIPEYRQSSMVLGIACALLMYSVFLIDYIQKVPQLIAQRPIRTQADLTWLVSRKWRPIKLAWLATAAAFVLHTELLRIADVFTTTTMMLTLGWMVLWFLSAIPVFGFSHIEKKSLLYTDKSSICS